MMATSWLVAYDIANPKRLHRVAQELEAAGARVQDSVFECGMTRDAMIELRTRIARQIDATEDKILYVPTCPVCRTRVLWQGKWAPFVAEPFWIV